MDMVLECPPAIIPDVESEGSHHVASLTGLLTDKR